ncbi:MAG: hypothetical protein KBT33_05615 [Prevotellaceae bacterium]|nr:hypothetical protein [Candidatus Minthosoma equi]
MTWNDDFMTWNDDFMTWNDDFTPWNDKACLGMVKYTYAYFFVNKAVCNDATTQHKDNAFTLIMQELHQKACLQRMS